MPRIRPLPKLVLSAILLALLCVAAPGSAAAVPEAPAALDAVPATLGATNVFPITTSSFEAIHHLPAVAYNVQRDEFLVVWHTEYGLGGTRDVWGQIVRKNGQLMGSPFVIATA